MTMLLPNNFTNETLELMERDLNKKIDELQEKNETYDSNIEGRNGVEELMETYIQKREVVRQELERRQQK